MSTLSLMAENSKVSAVPQRLALINGIVERNDAISAHVRDMAQVLTLQGYDVSVFCHKNDYDDIPAVIVENVADLVLDERYLAADLLIWHFGIFYDLFNAVLIGNGRARQVVCFHNVTPKAFTPEASWPLLERSLAQAHLMAQVDEVWADSDVNAQEARDFGASADAVRTIPLIVDYNPFHRLVEKTLKPVRVLYVGRFVSAKGVLDLLQASATVARGQTRPVFKLTLIGNESFSDPLYIKSIRAFIERHDLTDEVDFLGTVDDITLRAHYEMSHLLATPSYHEGFCKPVVEALRAGCIPFGYASYNLPQIMNGYGRLVKAGDIAALAEAMRTLIQVIPKAIEEPDQSLLPLDGGALSVNGFDEVVKQYVGVFTAARVTQQLVERTHALALPL